MLPKTCAKTKQHISVLALIEFQQLEKVGETSVLARCFEKGFSVSWLKLELKLWLKLIFEIYRQTLAHKVLALVLAEVG